MAKQMPPTGSRSSRSDHGSYVEVPPSFLTDIPLLVEWVEKSIAYVHSLPVKKKRR